MFNIVYIPSLRTSTKRGIALPPKKKIILFQGMLAAVKAMASSTLQMHPFASTVTSFMQSRFPEVLADHTFDNVGLLLESPWSRPTADKNSTPQYPPLQNTALLTVDLTTAVADEAIRKNVSIIVAYHPPIFRPLKRLSLQDSQQRSLLRLAQAGISIYSPHTAIDAHPLGNAFWFGNRLAAAIDSRGTGRAGGFQMMTVRPCLEAAISAAARAEFATKFGATRLETAGAGRIMHLDSPISARTLVRAVQDVVGRQPLSIASPPERGGKREQLAAGEDGGGSIQSFAVCLGSGAEVLKGCNADVLITGEMSHHETLAAVERGQMVIAMRHSVGEREYLAQVLRPMMQKTILRDLIHNVDLDLGEVQVLMSEVDRDPFDVLTDEIMD